MSPAKNRKSDHPRLTSHHPGYNSSAHFWMWVGVSSVVVMIIALWGWSLQLQLAGINWSVVPEKRLLDTTRANWDATFEEYKAAKIKENTKTEIAARLTAILATPAAATNTAATSGTTNLPPTKAVRK